MADDTRAAGGTVEDAVPRTCDECGKALSTTAERNRQIDYGLDWCDECEARAEAETCACSYGYYLGGDPRRFVPDDETNTPEEIARWRSLCAAWERGEAVQPAPEEHGPWIAEDGTVTLGARPDGAVVGVCHAVRSLGLGATYCAEHGPALDAWKRWQEGQRDD